MEESGDHVQGFIPKFLVGGELLFVSGGKI